MNRRPVALVCVLFCVSIRADVSHLKAHQSHRDAVNDGYVYDPAPPPIFPSPVENPVSTASTIFLPEIIVNKQYAPNVYLPPPPPSTESPALADEPNLNGYLPPFLEQEFVPPQPTEPIETPQPVYLPPEQPPLTTTKPANNYLPPTSEPSGSENNGYHYSKPKQSKLLKNFDFLRNHKSNALQLVLNDLRCLEGRNGHFRANIIVQSFIENLPIVDLDAIDSRCQLQLIGTKFYLDIPANDFQRCGIFNCGKRELCAKLRFPQIFGMKSIGDGLLTLKCKLQERIIKKTHTLRFGVANLSQGRSAGVLAQGGGQQPFRTQLGLYRQSSSGFTKSLDAGDVVQLGEELMLRAQVSGGGGWNHSRLTDVALQRVGQNGEILNSASLVHSNGCINPAMRSVCSVPPTFEPPLGHRFGFHAVLFQGMKSGDEMLMTVRMVGCVDQRDCLSNCIENGPVFSTNRAKRQIKLNDTNSEPEELVEVSKISFRVEMPTIQERRSFDRAHGTTNTNGRIAFVATLSFVAFLVAVAFAFNKRQIS